MNEEKQSDFLLLEMPPPESFSQGLAYKSGCIVVQEDQSHSRLQEDQSHSKLGQYGGVMHLVLVLKVQKMQY